MYLTDRFGEALRFAERLHREQSRKGNEIPYVAHLLAVAATVLEWGGDEDTAIAALLHDAVEDQGGLATAELIRERFGDRVADLVLACSDSVSAEPGQKRPWEERKAAYIAKLASIGRDVALITAADKLHNLTAIVRDVRAQGTERIPSSSRRLERQPGQGSVRGTTRRRAATSSSQSSDRPISRAKCRAPCLEPAKRE